MARFELTVILSIISLISQIALSSVTPQPINAACEQAFNKCDFRFQALNGLPTFSISGWADDVFTPRIISRTPEESLGGLNKNGIATEFIHPDGQVQKISEVGEHKLSPTHFKPLTILELGGSGIAHETFEDGQLQVASGKCVRVFFTQYQTLFPERNMVRHNMNDVIRNGTKCVVFRTKV